VNNNKLNKIDFWKNFIGFWVLIVIISCIFFFNIKIGFTIFEGISFYFNIPLFLFLSIIVIDLIIVFVMLAIFYNSIKIKLKMEEIKNG